MHGNSSGKELVTYKTFPVDKNQILVRFTNLADRFDNQDKV